jgi:hypothetical protein
MPAMSGALLNYGVDAQRSGPLCSFGRTREAACSRQRLPKRTDGGLEMMLSLGTSTTEPATVQVRMRLAVLCLMLSSCGPVLLGEEEAPAQDSASTPEAGQKPDAAPPIDATMTGLADAGPLPSVVVRVELVDCGNCFVLHAQGMGGHPPYEFEWEDGSLRAERRVCVENAVVGVSVVARDASSARSARQVIHLQGAGDADCAKPMMPAEPPPRPKLCLQNLSLEGTPAANFGQDQAFDAVPWTACTTPPGTTNTPDVGNETVAQTLGPIPKATEGLTYVALGEGEQISQEFCSALPDDGPVSLQLDLARINIGAGIVPETEQVFLEVWGGLSVDCSQRELLWASRALQVGWKTYCITLRPRAFMTQLTFRANADMTQPTPAYLLIDNLKPVDSCP